MYALPSPLVSLMPGMREPRSFLFIPGNRSDMLQKALGAAAGGFIPDMEDAVPWAEKTAARRTIASHLPDLAASGKVIIPRLNSLDTGLFEADLAAVAGPLVSGVSVGKVRGAGDVRRIAAAIDVIERRRGLAAGSIGLMPWIETAPALVAAFEVCSASPRVRWVAFGAEDLSNDLGIAKDLAGWTAASADTASSPALTWARASIVAAARAAGVPAIDTPYVAYRDSEGLASEAEMARSMGFSGKFAIHPAQVGVINATFAPTRDEIANARRVVEAAEDAEARGLGATSLDGKLIDRPTVERARSLLRAADA